MRLLALLALLAACGGKSAPAPAKDTEQAKIERDLAELKAFADRACACTDRACTDAINEEMADEFRTADLDASSGGTTPEQDQQIERDLVRMLECIVARGTQPDSLGVIAVRLFDRIRTEICACRDGACVMKSVDAWQDAMTRYGTFPLSDSDKADLEQRILPEATACFTTGGKIRVEEAVLELKAIRKDACACVDAACGSAAKAEVQAWGARHQTAPIDATTDQQLMEIVTEAMTCVNRASAEAGQQALAELTALRDAACACAHSRCADEVQTGFDRFLETYADLSGTPESADLIGELAAEMSACLATARGE